MNNFFTKSLCIFMFLISTVSLSARGGGDAFAGGMAGGMFGGLVSGAMTAPRTQPAHPSSGITVTDFMNLRDNISRDMERFAERIDKKLREFQKRIDMLEDEISNLKTKFNDNN